MMLPSTAIWSVVTDDPMVRDAKFGRGVNHQVYDDLNEEVTAPAVSAAAAYHQAAYFLALGLRRAMWEELPRQDLQRAFDELLAKQEADTGFLSGMVCSATGFMCPQGDPVAILDLAIDTVEKSELSSDDKAQILHYLRPSRQSAWMKKMAPLMGVAVLSAAAVGVIWYRRSRTK